MKKYNNQIVVQLNDEQYKKLEYLQINLKKLPIGKSKVMRILLENYKIDNKK